MTRAYEPIAFPDAEDLLVQYLGAELAARGESAMVHTQIPISRPDRFVVLPRVGGARRNLVVDSPTIAVECWGNTAESAYGLCRMVRALLGGLVGRIVNGVQFYRVDELGGPVNLPDPVSHQSRYTMTVSLSLRGIAL